MDWKLKAKELLKNIENAIDAANDPDEIMMSVDDLATFIAGESNVESEDEDDE
jgi:hypothetical protein